MEYRFLNRINFTLRNEGLLAGEVTYGLWGENPTVDLHRETVIVPGRSEVEISHLRTTQCEQEGLTVRLVHIRPA